MQSTSTSAPIPALTAKGLRVRYSPTSSPALFDASLSLYHGHIKALIGPNGAGKSTLFKALMGLVPHVHGTVDIPGGRGKISYVPQHDDVNWNFPISVKEVVQTGVLAGAKNKWIGRLTAQQRQHVRDALKAVDLEHLADRHISELSGGQKKRVFVARGLAQKATIILLDEPFAGVDQATEHSLIELLHSLRDQGVAMLIATHNLDQVPRLADSVLMLNRTVIAEGDVEDTLTKENLMATYGWASAHTIESEAQEG
ncbi:ATP-binding cassette domain-containing protein [Corynebacterium sp. zg254]|uniref:Metal ABC transporter ATP-binding protein n=1 Tax=Corynebacterium zhongnanshanii TaxID=2768834 RepID=A0ABQ6VFB7_9CORY|nr:MULTISPECIES: metal ABC transporter ATP-binding protein [Corynebacterium]KAB3523102.1 metal ABC transporter ATP-binding protein [Corynebacterium zhongnanshanii]MCR5913799.1 ATP-binding cassette domain-containing protein [Corynebacterium sp. zg254]